MNRVPDRKKLRREYVRQKAGAHVKGTVGAALLLPTTLFCCLFSIVTLMLVLFIVTSPNATSAIGAIALSAAILTALSGVLVRWCWRARHEFRRATEIPYVPPVIPDALPAEEILVRGADEPAVQSEVLLRATQMGQETPQEELLRVAEE